MVDLSECGLLVGYLSWVAVDKVNWSEDWMIGWKIKGMLKNMRRAPMDVEHS